MGEALTGDTPALVLVHAAGVDRRMWGGVAAGLEERGHTVDAVDLLGHGDAPEPPRGFGVADLADDLVGRLPTAGPVVLVGLSLGGMVAQTCALHHASRVAGLVLTNTMARPSEPMRDALGARAERTERLGMAGVVDETLERWFPATVRQHRRSLLADVRSWLLDADPSVNADTWRAIARFDVLDELRRVGAPALVVSGGADASIPAPVAKEMVAALPDVRHVELHDAGHMVPLEQPERFVAEVDAFVRGTVGEGGHA